MIMTQKLQINSPGKQPNMSKSYSQSVGTNHMHNPFTQNQSIVYRLTELVTFKSYLTPERENIGFNRATRWTIIIKTSDTAVNFKRRNVKKTTFKCINNGLTKCVTRIGAGSREKRLKGFAERFFGAGHGSSCCCCGNEREGRR